MHAQNGEAMELCQWRRRILALQVPRADLENERGENDSNPTDVFFHIRRRFYKRRNVIETSSRIVHTYQPANTLNPPF